MPAAAPLSATTRPSASADRPRFASAGAFHRDLKARVDTYFRETGKRERDVPAMYLKSAIILTWWATSWMLLVFFASSLWAAILLCASLGLAIAAIGMSVMHDANHGGYSGNAWVNRLMGWTTDAMGASSHVWKTKHNAAHHTFTNINGYDDDLNIGPLARLSPEQPRRPWHRLQHIYFWVLYGFINPKWVFIDDVVNLTSGRVGPHALPRPTPGQWFGLLSGKAFFLTWGLAIPLLLHPGGYVALAFFGTFFVTGVTLAVTFQLAHCVEEAAFPAAPGDGRMVNDWAVHQMETTVDFAPNNPVCTWLMGGLNFQVEHHLFPRICHLHYPALSRIVEATAAEHGVPYKVAPTLRSAIASHYRLLQRLGRPEPVPAAAVALPA